MSVIEERMASLGYTLPEIAAPVAAYVPATQLGNFVYTSGQLPMVAGKLPQTGQVAAAEQGHGYVSVAEATKLAEICALNGLAAARGVLGSLDRIKRVAKVTVFVNSHPDFTDQALVANGASLLFGEIFGDAGIHVRSAVGVAALPLNAPVEIEFMFEVTPD
ncbi:RidA family protein [Leucobacter sp. OH2974_COT-288]|uniref:Enamine deaminase RidA (YjgF/YER057c/UK114 family) n=1 Tax=Canibacter oris TaxID=1365628 RepID=A0A840DP00_9MICO|nr:enamine deaminase RidA (YjgF/YER057c/UK114 family) [Canibacter oris]RRD35132.1 RidA family protein [Leucobacter sp. OH2974_COT-288]